MASVSYELYAQEHTKEIRRFNERDRARYLSGRGHFNIDIQAHLGFKRMVSCCFHNRRMRLKTRAYGSSVGVSVVSSFNLAAEDMLAWQKPKANQLMFLARNKKELLVGQAKHQRRACEEQTCSW